MVRDPGSCRPGASEPGSRELGGRELGGREPNSRDVSAGEQAFASARERRPPLWQSRPGAGLALASLRQCHPSRLVLAVPVIDGAVARSLEPALDGLVALAQVRGLRSVGAWYRHFGQVEDATVLALLAEHRGGRLP